MNKSSASPIDEVKRGAAYYLFQSSVDPIILTDLAGVIFTSNKQTYQLLGYGLEDLKGSHIAGLFEPEQELPDFTKDLSRSLHAFQAVIPDKHGQESLHVQVHATSFELDGSAIVQWVLHDITRQVELDKLRQDLAAMLVHDLQGPLGNVLSSLELAMAELPAASSENVRLMLDVALRSSQQLKYLIDSLMDISHLEAGYPISSRVAVDVNELVDFVLAVEELDIQQRGVTVACTISPGLPAVFADESMLRRVLINLLDNALKHSQNGQTVTIAAQLAEQENMVLLSVIDQGQGIPEIYHDLIFEKFQRVRTGPASRGLGLGLAFCRLAIEAHGGRIWVENAPEGGACFSFTLPTAGDGLSASARSARD